IWVCASHASAGSLNFGVRVSGSGPGIVGLCMVPSAVLNSRQINSGNLVGRIFFLLSGGGSGGWLGRLRPVCPGSGAAVDVIDVGRLQRGDRRCDELLD